MPQSKTTVRKLKFFSSLRTKFTLAFVVVVVIVLLFVNAFFLTASRNNIFMLKKSFVENQAALAAVSLEDKFITLTPEDEDRISFYISQLEVANGTHIIITDENGSVIYDPTGRSDTGNFPYRYFERAQSSNDIFMSEFTDGVFSSFAFTPVITQGVIVGVVCFCEDDISQGALLLDMQSTIFNISMIIAAGSILTVTLIVISVMRRVNSIIKAVKSVREGEYNYTITMNGNDELALLSDEFNSLTGRLRETDEVRRRFVADASHELKTPLATIRLMTDSILQNQDIDLETVFEFIGDINMEAERLARTTDKLMTLTRLDSQIDTEITRVDMKEAVTNTVRMLKSLAASKHILIRTQLSDGCYIRATEDSVHHIIFNLLENAIKYNKPDGSVFIRLDIRENRVVLVVKDRGIGIPEEDMPHIFDRFYRVDKARSHDAIAAGSGLGLAIVRDTVRDLNGHITVENRQNGGTTFTVDFALYTDSDHTDP